MRSRNLYRNTGVSSAEMRARVQASLNFTRLTGPTTSTCSTPPTAEEAAIAAEEKRYADQRVAYR